MSRKEKVLMIMIIILLAIMFFMACFSVFNNDRESENIYNNNLNTVNEI